MDLVECFWIGFGGQITEPLHSSLFIGLWDTVGCLHSEETVINQFHTDTIIPGRILWRFCFVAFPVLGQSTGFEFSAKQGNSVASQTLS